jgi:anti-sigma factor (TIGR02949 family)
VSCREVVALLDAFLDGELPPEEVFDVEQHLSTCDTCAERERFESAVRGSLKRAAYADRPSVGFEARLAGALRAERERVLDFGNRPPEARQRRTAVLPLFLAAATTFGFVMWLNRHVGMEAVAMNPVTVRAPAPAAPVAVAQMDPEQVLEELVDYHAAPPAPQVTEPGQVLKLQPEVGVPVRLPALKQFGASWEGGSVVPMKNQHAAYFRYRLSNHAVTVYVYDARRVPLRGVLEPKVVHNQPVSVGERRGYAIAAREQHGIGYAVAADTDDESAELVTTMYSDEAPHIER